MSTPIDLCTSLMEREELPDLAVRTFVHHLARVEAGESGKLGRSEIAPVSEIPSASDAEAWAGTGRAALDKVAVIKLNGGLGTSMGLERAKSLVPVRDGLTFLDLIARQVLALRRDTGTRVPVLFMNSFRTDADTADALAAYPDLPVAGLPLGFRQHRVPKVRADSLLPARHESDPELSWCPPGHGDIYAALATSGVLDALLSAGIDYAFLSNADNLGAVFDAGIFGLMIERGFDFVMETADRTDADRKGGHLCRLKSGRLALRELAQCPDDELDEFSDIGRYRFFNSNSVWVHLPTLRDLLAEHHGVLPLSTIVNRKNLDPRDPDSAPVLQLETAMGAAISLFPNAAAIRIPRQRFSPVKTTNDLLGVRSDAYERTPDWHLRLDPSRTVPPTIHLDPAYFKHLDDFERRFASGTVGLLRCDRLEVLGDVSFAPGVTIVGEVRIRARSGPAGIGPGAIITADLDLD